MNEETKAVEEHTEETMNSLIEDLDTSFNEEDKEKLEITKVEESPRWYQVGEFIRNWGDRNVTGKEVNKVIQDIQNVFIANNNRLSKVVGNMRDGFDVMKSTYKTIFEGLNVQTARHTAQIDENKKINDELQGHYEIIMKTINALKDFKARIDALEHLYDIDALFDQYEELRDGYVQLHEQVMSLAALEQQQAEKIKLLGSKLEEVYKELYQSYRKLEDACDALTKANKELNQSYEELNLALATMKGELQVIHTTVQNNNAQQMALITALQQDASKSKMISVVAIVIAIISIVINFVR
ncbi:hypothetical protein [uncultured Veillonella sp.]|uniref:hypothetical protein n=1 Tax=uncultured Veillonella sp. TaxID=159268 RepID=UPI0025E2701C|nr:hypothetical protein [uncultured Veillonella sp.]